MADLKVKKVGSQVGTIGTLAIEAVPGIESMTYDEVGLAMEELYSGRLDAVVCDDPVASNKNTIGQLPRQDAS